MKDNLKYIVIGVILIFGIINFINPKIEYVDVPVRIEVPIPSIKKVHDTVYIPVPYKVLVNSPVNKKLSDSLDKANTIIDSLKAYKDFVIKRKYTQVFDDSTQTITVFAETTGTLDALQASYKTKPRVISLDTIIKVEIPARSMFFYGGSIGLPVFDNNTLNVTPVFKADLYLKTKKDLLINLSVDTDGRVWGGYSIKF
jgi:hypothetical protein